MKFVRENLFLIVLASLVLLGGGGMVAAYFKVHEDVQKAIDQRTTLAQTLQGLENQGANAEMVAAAEKRVETIKASAGTVARMCIEWNRSNLQVLQLKLPESDQTVPAFPYDEELYRDHGLGYIFTKTYVETMQSLLNSLRPTGPPTQGEIESQRLQWENQLMQRMVLEAGRAPSVGGIRPGMGQPPAGPPTVGGVPFSLSSGPLAPLPNPEEAADMTRATVSSIADPSVAALAMEKGRESAMLLKARRGAVYVDPSAIDLVYREPALNPLVVNLWQAQLNLWVTHDIVAAINATNEEAFAKADQEGKERDVVTAAVKRLAAIQVNENYVLPSAEETVAVPTRRRYNEEEEEREEYTPLGAITEAGRESASVLTRRGSSKDYDVLHYSFLVVMPTRYLPMLQRHLMACNYHTILSVQIRPADAPLSLGGITGYAPSSTSENYYYGPEPVVQVEIGGELLLLAAWERGTWDKKNNTWSQEFPPLIPVEALMVQYPNRDYPALRPEDASRFPKTTEAGVVP